MTEMTVVPKPLPPPVERFVLHWGEMGAVWGTNRSVGQIHALLYLAERPLTAEEIADTLGLARSNVSTSLKELMSWQLIRRVPMRGDRRDFFAAETDLWEMVMRIAEGRKAREIDPTLATLRACAAQAGRDRETGAVAQTRIADMLTFVEMVDAWARDISRLPRGKLAIALKLGGAIARYLPGKAGKATAGKSSSRS